MAARPYAKAARWSAPCTIGPASTSVSDGGGAWSDTRWQYSALRRTTPAMTDRVAGRRTGRYNWQAGSWVFGLEADGIGLTSMARQRAPICRPISALRTRTLASFTRPHRLCRWPVLFYGPVVPATRTAAKRTRGARHRARCNTDRCGCRGAGVEWCFAPSLAPRSNSATMATTRTRPIPALSPRATANSLDIDPSRSHQLSLRRPVRVLLISANLQQLKAPASSGAFLLRSARSMASWHPYRPQRSDSATAHARAARPGPQTAP